MTTSALTRAEREELAVKWEPCSRCKVPAGVWCKKNRRKIGNTGLITPGTRMKGVHSERIELLGKDYYVKCCGTWTHANGGTCPHCQTRFEVVANAKTD